MDSLQESELTNLIEANSQLARRSNSINPKEICEALWETWTNIVIHPQRSTVALLAAAEFMRYCSVSIVAPFFPKEAELREMSSTLVGALFGTFALCMVVFALLFGKLIPILGVKRLYVTGGIVVGLSSIAFGLLPYSNDHSTFTALSFVIRGVEGAATSAQVACGFTMIFAIFPEVNGTLRGLLQIFLALGLSIGPLVGSFLYDIAGFGLPFYFFGLLSIALTPLNLRYLTASEGFHFSKTVFSLRTFFAKPSALLNSWIIIVYSINWSFIEPILEPAIRKFGLTSGSLALIFLIKPVTFGLLSPIFGSFSDKMIDYWILISTGLSLATFGLLFLGPSAVLPFMGDSIWLKVLALGLLGISLGIGLMPTMQALLDVALEGNNTQVALGITSLLSCFWFSLYSSGQILGPILSGILLEYVGFPNTGIIIAAINLATVVPATVLFYRRKIRYVVCISVRDIGNK